MKFISTQIFDDRVVTKEHIVILEELTPKEKEIYNRWFICPYCGETTPELRLCCGELHGKEIKEDE